MGQWKARRRVEIAVAQEWLCYYCRCQLAGGTTFKPGQRTLARNSPTLEHIIPRSRKAKGEQAKLAVSCHSCNNDKGDMSEAEFLVRLPTIMDQRMAAKGFKRNARERVEAMLAGHARVEEIKKSKLPKVRYEKTTQTATFSLGEVLGPLVGGGQVGQPGAGGIGSSCQGLVVAVGAGDTAGRCMSDDHGRGDGSDGGGIREDLQGVAK